MLQENPQCVLFRKLRLTLSVSLILNASLLSLLVVSSYLKRPSIAWVAYEPLRIQEDMTTALQEGLLEMNALSFEALLPFLRDKKPLTEGYRVRDLALALLIGRHEFDLERALFSLPKLDQVRTVTFEGSEMTLYPGLSEEQMEAIIKFADKERWPLTPEGLFQRLKKVGLGKEPSLEEAFAQTEEFQTLELLFQRSPPPVARITLLQLLLEGEFSTLRAVLGRQRLTADLSAAEKKKVLLDYQALGSPTAYLIAQGPPTPAKEVKNNAAAKKKVEPVKRTHVVQPGESLWTLSRRYKVSISSIKEKNKLTTELLKPGSILEIP